MADGGYRGTWKTHFCTKFLLGNECPRGFLCPYVHCREPDNIVLARRPTEGFDYVVGHWKAGASTRRTHNPGRSVCHYYNSGRCQYGTRCRFLHIMPNRVEDSRLHRYRYANPNPSVPSTSTENTSGTADNEEDGTPKLLSIRSIDEDDDKENTGQAEMAKSSALKSEDWVNAPEFVPKSFGKSKSYAEVLNPLAKDGEKENSKEKLCPYAEGDGFCKYPPGECSYLHGDMCDLCGRAALHPHNEELRKKHTQECIKQHERDMELSFAVARSKEKSCGVCFEIIMEKSTGEQRFGILPNCNHCFCLTCIRKWRQARQFENKIIRACPECRVTSDFVCPSMYWVDTKEEKDKLIDDYKEALSKKDCKYFKQGRGKCPFGNKCFYLHALPDGTKTDVGPPPRQRRMYNNGDIEMLQQIILWDFFEERDNSRWLYSLADDLEDLVAFFSDSEDSDWSDYDVLLD